MTPYQKIEYITKHHQGLLSQPPTDVYPSSNSQTYSGELYKDK
jgi:hypothetical protein